MEGSAATEAKRAQPGWADDGLHIGDIILLQAGDLVPADLELVEARGLEVDEWELTGELRPIEKRVGDEAAFVFRGSRVTRGSGKGVVVATRAQTQYGQILKQAREHGRLVWPPLVKRHYCLLLILLLPPFVAVLRRYNSAVLAALLFLAVAAAMVVLQSGGLFRYLLISMLARRLEAHGIRVRDATCLDVVSRLDVVCLDKTGVLTTPEIEVGSIHFPGDLPAVTATLPDDERGRLVGIGCALCNDVFFVERRHQADPVDRALMTFALQHGFDIDHLTEEYTRVYDKPFDSEDRYMVAGFERHNQKQFFVKGDPEVILRLCSSYATASGGVRPVDGPFLGSIRSAEDLAGRQGDIVIALATGHSAHTPLRHYTFLCLVQLHNPVRPGAHDEVRKLKGMGIRPLMLTGDRPEAAMAVSKQVGIGIGPVDLLTGKEMARMALQEVASQATHVPIFARLLPSQKGVLVRLLQRRGHTVAMIGDGANDTIALRVADVGISFGARSSPFAKRVSGILIHETGDFLTIVAGMRRMERWLRLLMVLRITVLVSLLGGAYWWMLR